jgi:hypothetical protein
MSWPGNAPSSHNWIIGNIITSNTGRELAGIHFTLNQGSNLVSFNDLSQNVVAGIIDQSICYASVVYSPATILFRNAERKRVSMKRLYFS